MSFGDRHSSALLEGYWNDEGKNHSFLSTKMILKFVLFYFVIISVTPEHNIKLALAQSVLNRFVNTLISTPIQPISSFKPILDFLNPFSSEPISAYTKQGQGISNYRPGQSHQSLTDRAPEANDQLRSNSQPSVCTGYWFYQHDKNNGNSGLLKIPNPSRTQNDVRITLSLPFRLQLSVSFVFFCSIRFYLIIFSGFRRNKFIEKQRSFSQWHCK